ncbi:hypothetical protein EAH69_02405 [Faecalibacter macacae]|uniref:Uncharacterized protein n=2 Tax=Faecalibacter macacae TaxID=1859289 RepID=A0A3L9MP04_9FLAO|nr:hypothetical protein EAH69_02405 [Faecalibacter macacae]
MRMKNRFKIIFFALLIICPLIIWIQIRNRQAGKKEFELFYSTSIYSKLKSITAGTNGTRITLVNNRNFVFSPYSDEKLNKGNIFDHIAKEGDIVIKKAYSDSLILINENDKFIFMFNKFEK